MSLFAHRFTIEKTKSTETKAINADTRKHKKIQVIET